MSTQVRCDCCGLMVRLTDRDDCPRCGYPVAPEKETQFLADNLRNLQRVATYGGASLSVVALIARYQQRQNYLWWLRTQQTPLPATPTTPVQQPGSTANIPPPAESFGTGTTKPVAAGENPSTPSPVVPEKIPARFPETSLVSQEPVQPSLQVPPAAVMPPPVVPPKATRTFSFKAFFADQTINIVSSLGAFLILIGSLSFIVTTPDRRLSFFTLLIVHALFGILGTITRQFKSFRIVSIIYTAIFALQVPLVGLAGYRLVSETQLSPSGLVAIAAAYAAIVYSALAIHQRFQPFVYLAAVSITVVDIALTITFNLAPWWWPSTLMVLALASLVCVSPSTGKAPPVQKQWDIFLQPVRVVMKGYVYTSYAYVLLAGLTALMTNSTSKSFLEMHFSIACTLSLLLCWTCLFVWRSRLSRWLLTGPYLFLACILAFAYAFSSAASGYVLVLTGIALLYHFIERFAHKSIERVATLREHIEFLVLASLCVIPLIADAVLPLRVFDQAYDFSSQSVTFSSEILIDIVALLCGIVLTGSIIISHTGWQKSPSPAASKWCWLLLLSGALLYWVYNLVGLMLPVVPVWSALALTGILLLTTFAARRFTSAAWADPLDILTLVFAAQTLLLGIPQGHVVLLALLLAFTTITYTMALYQQRVYMFGLTFVFAMLACIPLLADPTTLLILCILLPLVWSSLERFLPSSQWSTGNSYVLIGSLWTLPVLLISLLYTLEFLSTEVYHPVSTLGLWLQMPLFPIALELALLACIWYSTAIVARKKIGLVNASGLACLALFFPTSTMLVLTAIAFGSVLMAASISRLVGRDWGIPLYIIGLLAALMLAWSGQLQFTSWALLSFGACVYLISMIERESLLAAGLRWSAVVFVTWSLYDAGLLSEYAWAPIIVVLGVAIGLGIRMIIPRVSSTFSDKNKLWSYAGPLYAISLVAAILSGFANPNVPFYAAVPCMLMLYGLIAYGLALWEGRSWFWFCVGFIIWGVGLLPQSASYYQQSWTNPLTAALLAGVTLLSALLGLCIGRLSGSSQAPIQGLSPTNILRTSFRWNWPWYLIALASLTVTLAWCATMSSSLPPHTLTAVLVLFIGLVFILMLVERLPDLSLLVIGLAVWLIAQAGWDVWQMACAYSLLCLFVFAGQLLWKQIPPEGRQTAQPEGRHKAQPQGGHKAQPLLEVIPSIWLARVASLAGLGMVILFVITQGGLSPHAGLLAQSGVFALCIGAILLCWLAVLLSSPANKLPRYACYYGAGLLLSLTVPWELLAFGQTDVTWLTLVPASYMIVISPFLLHDKQWSELRSMGHSLALGGAMLLLLPTLWVSFDRAEVFPTLLLAAESLSLLVLGTIVRIRFFGLSGAALVVVSAIHLLFLPALGIPTFLALTLAGMLLLALATVLLAIRTRLAAIWSELN